MVKRDMNWVNLPSLMLMSITLMLSGCATPFMGGYGTKSLSKEDFSRYVESVFRLQNHMTSEIMLLSETDDVKNHDALLEAEQHMQEACGPLNEYASRDIDGLYIGLFLRRRVEKSAIDCEQAAQKVKSLLGR
jgi:hypothetical protein